MSILTTYYVLYVMYVYYNARTMHMCTMCKCMCIILPYHAHDCTRCTLLATMSTMWMVLATFSRCNLKASNSSKWVTLMWMMLA